MAVNAASLGAALASVWEHLIVGIPGGWTVRTRGAIGGVTGVTVPTFNGVWVFDEDAEREAVSGVLERVASAGVPYCLQLSLDAAGSYVSWVGRRG